MGLVLIVFSIYNQPSQQELDAMRVQDSINQVNKEKAETERKVAEAARKGGR